MAVKKRVYIFLGPETGQKKESLDLLRAQTTKEFGEAPEEYRFYGFEMNVSDTISLLKNGSLFAAHKLVVIHAAESIKGKDNVAQMEEYLKDPSPEATVVLLSDESKIEDKLVKAVPKDQCKIFWEMFESEKKGWVIKHFREIGLTVTPEAVEYLLEMVENSTDQLKMEAQKLLSYFEKGHKITLEDLEAFLEHSKEESVFTLFARVAEADLEGAIEILHKILLGQENASTGLVGGLLFQFRTLHQYARLAPKLGAEAAQGELRIRSKKQKDNLNRALKHYKEKDLERILVLFAEADSRIRGSRNDLQKIIIELFLYQIIVRKGKNTGEMLF